MSTNRIRTLSVAALTLAFVPFVGCAGGSSPEEVDSDVTGEQVEQAASAVVATNLALGKPATQSTTAYGGVASRAVDGNTDGSYYNGSVTHTADAGWWQVDLQSVQRIGDVLLFNRTDCCSERLQNFSLLLSSNGTDWQAYPFAGVAGPQVAFSVNRAARYVKVQANSGIYPLSLAEVQVFAAGNLALGKPATQSTTAYGGVASRAVDGNTDGSYYNGSVTHTADAGWWQVDLQSVQSLGDVVLFNRTDCCSERLQNFSLMVSSNGLDWQAFPYPGVAGPQVTLAVNRAARYVKVKANSGIYPLSLAEVQVFAGPAQSNGGIGTLGDNGGSPDGDTHVRGAATLPTCGAGKVMDGGLCYPACSAGYHGVGPLCLPDATYYDRGAGVPLVSSCGAGNELNGLLCYPTCAAGYAGAGPVCWQICPQGYKDTGAFCEYDGNLTTGCNGGVLPCSCPDNYYSSGLWCTKVTFAKASYGRGWGTGATLGCSAGLQQDGGLCYPPCSAGHHGVANGCWPDAVVYGRGMGTLPTTCEAGKTHEAGLCYPACQAGYHGVGPVCWSDKVSFESITADLCGKLYVPVVTQLAQATGKVHTFGFGAGMAAGATAAVEAGVAYGPGGEFGCFVSVCTGVAPEASINAWGTLGLVETFDSMGGDSIVMSAGAGVEIPETPLEIGGSVAGEFSTSWVYQGVSGSVSLGVGYSPPITLGVQYCHTEFVQATGIAP